jgi:formylmethanofuran dehydrogenase subunit B
MAGGGRAMTGAILTENGTCLGCGCACDDIDVVVSAGRIAEARNACPLGRAWFGDGNVPLRCVVNARDVMPEEALRVATDRLSRAKRVLVYLAPGLSCEAQRAGTAIADLLGGVVDSATSATALHQTLASQERGFASATLGEIRNRADVMLLWAVDLDRRYPRFSARYGPDAVGTFVPDGRRSRRVIAVDVGDAATGPVHTDRRFAVVPAAEVATLTALTSLVAHGTRAPTTSAPDGGSVWSIAGDLAAILRAGRYVALVYDAEPDERAARSNGRFDALAALAQALNDTTRCAAVALRAGGNRSGADAILTAHTGYPMAVDFARGFPRYRPHDGSALVRLRARDIDAVLVLGDAALIPPGVMEGMTDVASRVVVGQRASEFALGSDVAIDTGVPGIHSAGTALRTDDVPLPLRPCLSGPPSVDAVAAQLVALLATGGRRGVA